MDIARWRRDPEQAIRSSANPCEDGSIQVLTVPKLRHRRWKKVNDISRQPDFQSLAGRVLEPETKMLTNLTDRDCGRQLGTRVEEWGCELGPQP